MICDTFWYFKLIAKLLCKILDFVAGDIPNVTGSGVLAIIKSQFSSYKDLANPEFEDAMYYAVPNKFVVF